MDLNRYKNKYFSILGDSISTFEGVSLPKEGAFYDTFKKLSANVLTVADTWWGQVIDALGGRLLVNNSISGSTVTWHKDYEYQSYGCSDERTRSLHKDGAMPNVIMNHVFAHWPKRLKTVLCSNKIKSLCGVAQIVVCGTLEPRPQRFARHVCTPKVTLLAKAQFPAVIRTKVFANIQTLKNNHKK